MAYKTTINQGTVILAILGKKENIINAQFKNQDRLSMQSIMPVIPALGKAGISGSLQVQGQSGLESQRTISVFHVCHVFLFSFFNS